MSKKGKGVVILGSALPVGVGIGVYEDSKTRAKHQSLLQEYYELQREAEVMKRKLEAAREKKLTIADEVRFLRKRYKYLMARKTTHVAQLPKSFNQTKIVKAQLISRKEAYQHKLPPLPKTKKRRYPSKDVPATSVIYQKNPSKISQVAKETARYSLTPTSVLKNKERINVGRENYAYNYPVLDLNQMDRMSVVNDSTSKKASLGFDLNQDNSIPVRKETYLQTRAPIFDLNEVSMGDEDFMSNVEAAKYEEVGKSLVMGLKDEQQQNDVMIASSICRNSGEGSSRMGKRKISWQDPVALRV